MKHWGVRSPSRWAMDATLFGERVTTMTSSEAGRSDGGLRRYSNLARSFEELCSAMRTVSADVTQPEQARQSLRETVAFVDVIEEEEEEETARTESGEGSVSR